MILSIQVTLSLLTALSEPFSLYGSDIILSVPGSLPLLCLLSQHRPWYSQYVVKGCPRQKIRNVSMSSGLPGLDTNIWCPRLIEYHHMTIGFDETACLLFKQVNKSQGQHMSLSYSRIWNLLDFHQVRPDLILEVIWAENILFNFPWVLS